MRLTGTDRDVNDHREEELGLGGGGTQVPLLPKWLADRPLSSAATGLPP